MRPGNALRERARGRALRGQGRRLVRGHQRPQLPAPFRDRLLGAAPKGGISCRFRIRIRRRRSSTRSCAAPRTQPQAPWRSGSGGASPPGGDSREKDRKKAARTARRMREPERPFGLSAGGRPRSSGLSGHSPFERSSRNRMYSSFVKTGVNSRQIASAAFAPSQSRSMIVMASTSGAFTNAVSSSKSR